MLCVCACVCVCVCVHVCVCMCACMGMYAHKYVCVRGEGMFADLIDWWVGLHVCR